MMKAFLLAAGYGTRMGELTKNLPKPLLPVGGYPLIYYSLFWLWKWGAKEAIINLHYLGDKIEENLSNFSHFPIRFLYEEKILGTAGGIRNCIGKHLSENESFVLLNPDSLLLPDAKDHPKQIRQGLSGARNKNLQTKRIGPAKQNAKKPVAAKLPSPFGSSHCTLGLKKRDKQHFSGISFSSQSGTQIQFVNSGNYYYMGYSILHTQELLSIPAFADGSQSELGPVWKELAKQNRLHGFPFSGQVLDAGTKAAYLSIRDGFPLPKKLHKDWKEFLNGL